MSDTPNHWSRKLNDAPPAVIALLIQLLAVAVVATALTILWRAHNVRLSLPTTLVVQAALVLVLTRWCNLAWWWLLIQAVFPLAIVATLMLPIPSLAYFGIFAFLFFFYWSTFRTQVPYFPCTKKVWKTVERYLPAERSISFIDIGSGLGGLSLYLGQRRPESQFIGVEIAPLPWVLSHLRTVFTSTQVRFLRRNYHSLDFAEFDVVFAYLSPAAMPDLWEKASREMRPGSMLISYEFPIVGSEPDLIVCPDDVANHGPQLYLWYLK